MAEDLLIRDNTQQLRPEDDAPVVTFSDVSIAFDLKPVLENVSFSVSHGETRIILGPAGGGKSVLMKLTDGLLRPDSGVITVFGNEITAMSENELFKLRGRILEILRRSVAWKWSAGNTRAPPRRLRFSNGRHRDRRSRR